MIHPTAIVDPAAEIAAGVRIGPYCVIGPGVVIADDTELQHHVTVMGPTKIGRGNFFFAYTSIGQRTQDLKYAGEPTYLEIGDGNTFREFCTANRGTLPGTKTVIGKGGNFLAYSHIAHDCIVGDQVIFSNNGTLAGHVEVGDHAVIGGLAAIHQFCRVGRHAITGGCSKIVQDVPPFFVADGNPAEVRGVNQVGLERAGFAAETIRALKEAYRILYRGNLNVKQSVETIREELPDLPELAELGRFIESSQRGIIR
ncbi:MAG: acyl-ACP--UDP-N-acetylglucosamine O-acyltransferase [Chthoniobacterales bacterium]